MQQRHFGRRCVTTIGLAMIALVATSSPASAQSASAVSDGTAFAKSIAPSSSTQIVNPAGVKSSAWTSTAIPTAVPGSLGKFSAPNTSTEPITSAKAIGLAGYGNQAVANCAAFDPTTGDPVEAQTCAAVNFLSNRCLSPTTQQSAIMAANATAATPLAADCSGTYGQAQSSYGFAESESTSDPIFKGTSDLPSKAADLSGTTCSTSTVTGPPTYATYTCAKNDSSTEYTCYQYLNTSVNTTYTPATPSDSCTAPAVLEGGYCVSTTSSPAPVVYGCPSGEALVGSTCQSSSSTPATPVYACPPGFALSGSTCTETSSTPGTPSTTCPTITGVTAGKPYGYQSGTIDGVTGYCAYWFKVRDTLTAMPDCALHIPAPPNGSSLFYADNSLAVAGRDQKYLACYLTPEKGCPTGYTWNGSVCQELLSQSATITGYNCTSGTLSGSQCVVTTSNPANPSYNCPTGTVLSGTTCVSTTTAPPTVTYSCPGGATPVDATCITNYVSTSWVDTCTAYEGSAGITLPTPTP